MAGRDHYNPGKHVPKVLRCNAGRDEAAVYKNLGNGQRIKFLWADTVMLDPGTAEYEYYSAGDFGAGKSVNKPDHYAPGGGFYGKTLADIYVQATPLAATSGTIYVDIDTKNDTLTIASTDTADESVWVGLFFFTT